MTARLFWHSVSGYVMVLSLLMLPVLLGLALVVIDIARGDNLHTELQSAVDTMALAGGIELDGRDDAINRAEAAIRAIKVDLVFATVSLSPGGEASMRFSPGNPAASTVDVTFLTEVPGSDLEALDSRFAIAHQTRDPALARYVLVRSQPQSMRTLFPLPESLKPVDVSLAAQAVATRKAAACDVTPIFVCNPFETVEKPPNQSTAEFRTAFRTGGLYNVQFELQPMAADRADPGNYGFLRIGPMAGSVAEAMATSRPDFCQAADNLAFADNQADSGGVEDGFNTRFGLYANGFRDRMSDPRYRPARNVRKGQRAGTDGRADSFSCNAFEFDTVSNRSEPRAASLGYGGQPSAKLVMPGATAYENWDLASYWSINHGSSAPPEPAMLGSLLSDPSGRLPEAISAYDLYRYELANPALLADRARNGETGVPACHAGYDLGSQPLTPDRRDLFVAVTNCLHESVPLKGRASPVTLARAFLVKPMDGRRSLTVEFIDIDGPGGRGTVNRFLRAEGVLVR